MACRREEGLPDASADLRRRDVDPLHTTLPSCRSGNRPDRRPCPLGRHSSLRIAQAAPRRFPGLKNDAPETLRPQRSVPATRSGAVIPGREPLLQPPRRADIAHLCRHRQAIWVVRREFRLGPLVIPVVSCCRPLCRQYAGRCTAHDMPVLCAPARYVKPGSTMARSRQNCRSTQTRFERVHAASAPFRE